ncbi:MAG: hypothetical protein L0Z62_38970 [Gemmataceae bacterium]|nr:hypothetical protein [Gemmataceae bacterium]
MPDSPPSRGPTASARAVASGRDSSRPATAAPQVRVLYYRRMRPNRVYPVVVSWKGAERSTGGPVTLRLLMAGAQVVPLEQTLDPHEPDAKVTFHVTPLARGHLRGERLEVLQDGRKIQEIRLPCKATTQRATWILLLLTVLVAWFVVPVFDPTFRMRAPLAGDPDAPYEEWPIEYPSERAVASRLRRHLPPVLPLIREHLPVVASELEAIPDYIGAGYSVVFLTWVMNGIPVGEILLATFILLTLFSWWLHLERRKRRVGKLLTPGEG